MLTDFGALLATIAEVDHVDKGQIIAVLDSKELTARLRQAEAELAVAQAKHVEVAAGVRITPADRH